VPSSAIISSSASRRRSHADEWCTDGVRREGAERAEGVRFFPATRRDVRPCPPWRHDLIGAEQGYARIVLMPREHDVHAVGVEQRHEVGANEIAPW